MTTDAWARISGDRIVIDAARETLEALTTRLVLSSDDIHVCVVCGCDLISGETFMDRHGDDEDCELVCSLHVLPQIRP